MADGVRAPRRVVTLAGIVDDDAGEPASLAHFLNASARPRSVRVLPTEDVRALAGALDGVERVVLAWPKKATEGRGYSQARILREELGFRGRIRAVGEILVDHIFFMKRCGIDELILRDVHEEAFASAALSRFTVLYQGASDEPLPLHRRVGR